MLHEFISSGDVRTSGETSATSSGVAKYGCFGLTMHKLQYKAGASTDDIVLGFKSLIRVAMRVKSNELKKKRPRVELLNEDEFLFSRKMDDYRDIVLILKSNIRRNDLEGVFI